MEDKPKRRSLRQNRALHALYRMLADALNEAGLDMRETLRADIEIPWNESTVKEYLWRPIQKAMLQKQSTTELSTKEIDEVFDVLNKHLGERFGLHVPFPSVEEILMQQRIKER